MGKAITFDKIQRINETYLKCGTYAETARQVGVSASTVKKYIDPNYISKEKIEVKCVEIPKTFPIFRFPKKGSIEWNSILQLTPQETLNIIKFQKELSI